MKSLFTKVARAVGFETEHAESPEFTRKLSDFQTHVDDLQRVRDAFQLYSDSMEAMLAAQVILGDALDTYYRSSMQASGNHVETTSSAGAPIVGGKEVSSSTSAPAVVATTTTTVSAGSDAMDDSMMHHNIAKLYKKYGHHMHNTMRPVLHEVFVSRCIRPVNYILARVPNVHGQLARRKKLIYEFNEMQSQVSREKQPSQKSLALEGKLSEIKNEIQDNNHDLMLSLEEFALSRPLMLRQEFAAMVACSWYHVNSAVAQLGQLLPLLPQSASSMCLLQTADQFNEVVFDENDRLKKMKIVLERATAEGGAVGGYGLANTTGTKPPKPPKPGNTTTTGYSVSL